MNIFNYHPDTREYLGASKADPDPMEAGNWLFPAFSTVVEPPIAKPGYTSMWTGSAWSSVRDCRGETWWPIAAADNSTPGVVVHFFGDPAAQGLTKTEPPAPPAPPPPIVTVSPAQIRIALNRAGLRAAIEAYVATADQDIRDMWQFATEFRRDNVMILAAAAALAKTDAEIDALFVAAKAV